MMKSFIFSLLFLSNLVSICQGRKKCGGGNNTCENGGICQNATARCYCPRTYFGEFCEHMNECHKECPEFQVCMRKDHLTVCDVIESSIADIAIILDISGSIKQSEVKTMINTVSDFIMKNDVEPGKIHISVFAFNDYICDRIIKLNDFTNKTSCLEELMKYEGSKTGGGTRTDLALKYLRNEVFTEANGDREEASNIAMIFTDGQSNKPHLTKEESLKLKDTNIRMISVGIGDGVNLEELENIATRKEDVFLTNFKALRSLVGTLVNKARNVSVNPCYSNPCKNGGRCRPFLTEYVCNCQHPYVGMNCEIKCDISGDIMVVIDESRKIPEDRFKKIIDAVMFFIKALDIANGKVRLGIITFSVDVTVHYDLDAFDNKLDMLFVCDLLRHKYKGGPTYTHTALEYLKKFSFTPEKGDRQKYPNYVLFFTDGNSSDPHRTEASAKVLHASGVSVYAIGVGSSVERRELYQIASHPQRDHMLLTSFIRLELTMNQVVSRACKDLEPMKRCILCKVTEDCLSGMECCEGCCQDTVTLFG